MASRIKEKALILTNQSLHVNAPIRYESFLDRSIRFDNHDYFCLYLDSKLNWFESEDLSSVRRRLD